MNNIGIVVMDVCAPEYSYDYYLEKETNDKFVDYLNSRLQDLKNQGAKIIEINYMSKTHPALTVDFDISTISMKDLNRFINKHNIKHIVYTGFHYPICTNSSRSLGSYFVKNNQTWSDISMTGSNNGALVGPVTISGTITIPSGSTFVIL